MDFLLKLFIPICLIAYSVLPLEKPGQTDLLQNWEKVKMEIQGGKVLASQFEMLSTDQYNDSEQVLTGSLFIWKDGYRIETSQTKMLVYEGFSTVIDHEQKQVIQSNYVAEDDDFAPAKLLQEDWLATYQKEISESNSTIQWTTEDPFETFNFLEVRMGVAFPDALKASDQLQNSVQLFLTQQRWHAINDSSIFSLSLPDNYELIDLRNE